MSKVKILQTDRATYQLIVPGATRLEIAFFANGSRLAEDCYPPIILNVGQRVRIQAWFDGKNDAMLHPSQRLGVRCASDGIQCSDAIETHFSSEERPIPFLLFVRAEIEPFEIV
jgi:hypothetical protein